MKFGAYCALVFSVIPLATGEYVGGTPHDKPVDLGDDSFQAAIEDPANPFWFLKFYAPWCGHCKRMAPVLESIAPQLKGKMAIGKIDCTKEKVICNEHKVRGFPTMKYSVDGKVISEYTGGRDEEKILAFAKKMSSPPVVQIRRLEEAKKFAHSSSDEGIVFLGSGKQNSELWKLFSTVARKKQASAYFLWLEQIESPTDDGRDNSYVDRIEVGFIEPRRWEPTEGDLTAESFDAWVQDQNVPTLVNLTPSNFPKISRNGRPVLMGIIDAENEELVANFKLHMMEFLLRAPQEYVEKHYYGIFDGKKWQKFLKQFGVRQEDNPQFMILAPLNLPGEKTYWRNETYTTLPGFLKAVDDGSIPPRSPQKLKFNEDPLAWLTENFTKYLPFSFIPIFLLLGVIVWAVTPSFDDNEEHYEMIEHESKKDK